MTVEQMRKEIIESLYSIEYNMGNIANSLSNIDVSLNIIA